MKGYNGNFKDIANKLALARFGAIFAKDFVKGVEAADGEGFKIPNGVDP
jgi:hypothetical protein